MPDELVDAMDKTETIWKHMKQVLILWQSFVKNFSITVHRVFISLRWETVKMLPM